MVFGIILTLYDVKYLSFIFRVIFKYDQLFLLPFEIIVYVYSLFFYLLPCLLLLDTFFKVVSYLIFLSLFLFFSKQTNIKRDYKVGSYGLCVESIITLFPVFGDFLSIDTLLSKNSYDSVMGESNYLPLRVGIQLVCLHTYS